MCMAKFLYIIICTNIFTSKRISNLKLEHIKLYRIMIIILERKHYFYFVDISFLLSH